MLSVYFKKELKQYYLGYCLFTVLFLMFQSRSPRQNNRSHFIGYISSDLNRFQMF